MPPLSVPNLGRGRRSNSSTSCCAGVHIAVVEHKRCGRGARMVDNPNNDILSTIDIFVKDMGLVTEAARTNAYPTPLASAAEQLYLAGRRAGLGRADDSSLIQILRGTATAST